MKVDINKLNGIVDWILSLPQEEQFKLNTLDFIKLANMLEKYAEYSNNKVCDICGDTGRSYPALEEPDGVECQCTKIKE